MTELLLGLDVGTSAVKAAVVDRAGVEVAHGRAATPWREVATGAELDPGALLDAVRAAARAALEGAPDGAVRAVGVASMAETGVLLDRAGRPAVPSIAWHDARGAEQAERAGRELGADAVAATTGLPCTPLFTLAKYRWMRDNWPADSARGVRWLSVAEWIVRALGGEEAAELSLASRTGLLDLHARGWWADGLAWAGAPAGLLPEPRAAGTPLGAVTDDALPRLRGAVLTVGGHDHLSAAVGAGAAGEGDVLDSCGTAEALVRATAPLGPAEVARLVRSGMGVGWHAVPDRMCILGSIWSGSAFEHVLELLGVPVEERDALEAAALHADPGGLTAHGLEERSLTLGGIGRHASPAAAYRAVLEAAGAAGAAVLARMAEIAGPLRRLVVTGGWAAGPAARAVKLAHLGPFEHSPALSTGARGAAIAAGRAAGLWSAHDAPRGALEEVTR